MSISEKSYKIIWGQFSARCCLCRKDVIHLTDGGTTSLVGEVAHIVGERENAARGRSNLSSEERNDPDNLMLLCREHHKIVDDNQATYTVESLNEIKRKHLEWIVMSLGKTQPWQSNLSQLTYINVPRLCEQAVLNGFSVDLSKYRQDQTLHSLRWELNHVMSAFQRVLAHLEIPAVSAPTLKLHEGYIGTPISFDRLRFRTKNIAIEAMHSHKKWKQNFTGDLSRDPHIYAKIGSFKLVIFIDPNWITTSTAFTLFKPSSGQSTFSGVGIVSNVDYENQLLTATAWVIGLPKGLFDEATAGFNGSKRSAIELEAQQNKREALDDLVDMDEAENRKTYFSPPPEVCDLCRRSLAKEKYMIDGGVKGFRYWACMCSACFASKGNGIGWGVGQLYLQDEKGWLEVSGFNPNYLGDDV
jgi:hypothetical protein